MAQRVLQLMADYGVDDSPLWHQRSWTEVGLASAEELGLSVGLRADLRDWNDEATAGPVGEFEHAEWSPRTLRHAPRAVLRSGCARADRARRRCGCLVRWR